jgi:hypothetical protein
MCRLKEGNSGGSGCSMRGAGTKVPRGGRRYDPTRLRVACGVSYSIANSTKIIYEYACHEGNCAMEGILAGARAAEKSAAEAGKQ